MRQQRKATLQLDFAFEKQSVLVKMQNYERSEIKHAAAAQRHQWRRLVRQQQPVL